MCVWWFSFFCECRMTHIYVIPVNLPESVVLWLLWYKSRILILKNSIASRSYYNVSNMDLDSLTDYMQMLAAVPAFERHLTDIIVQNVFEEECVSIILEVACYLCCAFRLHYLCVQVILWTKYMTQFFLFLVMDSAIKASLKYPFVFYKTGGKWDNHHFKYNRYVLYFIPFLIIFMLGIIYKKSYIHPYTYTQIRTHPDTST